MLAGARFFPKPFGLVSLLALGAAQMAGSVAYISNCCNNSSTVNAFQTSDRDQTAQFSPDSSTAYVVASSAAVDIVNVSQRKLIGRITVAGAIAEPAISPDGSTLAIPNSGTAAAAAIDTPNGNTLASVPVGAMDWRNQLFTVVSATRVYYPMALAPSPDGKAMSTAANLITGTLPLQFGSPTQPVTGGLAVTPDGTKLFASDGSSTHVFEVDLVQNKVIGRIKAGQTPGTIAIAPDGSEVATSITDTDVPTSRTESRLDRADPSGPMWRTLQRGRPCGPHNCSAFPLKMPPKTSMLM